MAVKLSEGGKTMLTLSVVGMTTKTHVWNFSGLCNRGAQEDFMSCPLTYMYSCMYV